MIYELIGAFIVGAIIFAAGVYFGHALCMTMYNMKLIQEEINIKKHGKVK